MLRGNLFPYPLGQFLHPLEFVDRVFGQQAAVDRGDILGEVLRQAGELLRLLLKFGGIEVRSWGTLWLHVFDCGCVGRLRRVRIGWAMLAGGFHARQQQQGCDPAKFGDHAEIHSKPPWQADFSSVLGAEGR